MKLRNSIVVLSLVALTATQGLKSCAITITNDMHDSVSLKGNRGNSLMVSLKPQQSFTVKTTNKEQTHFHVVTKDHKSYDVHENFCKANGNKLNVSKIIKLSAVSHGTHDHANRFTVNTKASHHGHHAHHATVGKKEVAKHIAQHHLKALHVAKKGHHKAHHTKAHQASTFAKATADRSHTLRPASNEHKHHAPKGHPTHHVKAQNVVHVAKKHKA